MLVFAPPFRVREFHVLLLSLITLFAGPLLYLWLQRYGTLIETIDRLLVAVLLAIIVVLMVPEMFASLSWFAPGLVLLGYLLPGMLERIVNRAAQTMHIASLLAALIGLTVHALLDGAGLAGSKLQGNAGLAAVIIIHRFGVGMILWMIIRPAFGRRAAWVTLAVVSAATVAGFEFSARLLPLAGNTGIFAFQAVIVGTIVHSLVHRGHVHG